MKIFHVHEELT